MKEKMMLWRMISLLVHCILGVPQSNLAAYRVVTRPQSDFKGTSDLDPGCLRGEICESMALQLLFKFLDRNPLSTVAQLRTGKNRAWRQIQRRMKYFAEDLSSSFSLLPHPVHCGQWRIHEVAQPHPTTPTSQQNSSIPLAGGTSPAFCFHPPLES